MKNIITKENKSIYEEYLEIKSGTSIFDQRKSQKVGIIVILVALLIGLLNFGLQVYMFNLIGELSKIIGYGVFALTEIIGLKITINKCNKYLLKKFKKENPNLDTNLDVTDIENMIDDYCKKEEKEKKIDISEQKTFLQQQRDILTQNETTKSYQKVKKL